MELQQLDFVLPTHPSLLHFANMSYQGSTAICELALLRGARHDLACNEQRGAWGFGRR
jgi:hypothetical protein